MAQFSARRRLQFVILSIFPLLVLGHSAISIGGQEQAGRTIQPNRAVPDGKYVGSDACAECHADKVK
ncbi:MAG: hypothetical protein ACREAC_07880, partial [Blastocatellia bacterium]